MGNKRYSIGLDFGTLSARAILVDVENGDILPKESVFNYPHAVINALNGKPLPRGYALQHPADYIAALEFLICDLLSSNGVDSQAVVGIGIDFTDCTILPIDENLTPLCILEKYENEPHAYAKLWKHHAKEEYAKRISDFATTYAPEILSVTGNAMTSEFMIPKLYEIFCEARSLYDEAYKFISAGDFVASLLAGCEPIHSKAFSAKQHYDNGKYPSKDFFALIDEDFKYVYEEKTVTLLHPTTKAVGRLSSEWAEKTGLSQNVLIAPPIIDAHSAIVASGMEESNAILVLGTSAVLESVLTSNKKLSGLLSSTYESIAPSSTTIESGLAAMGDLFEWFISNCVPGSYEKEAEAKGLNLHQYLRSLAEKQEIGEHGLIALDWWNGCRSIRLDNSLSGVITGLRLSTRPEDVYRALIESTAFGIRRILENLQSQGIFYEKILATGGISRKDPFLMQIFADVLALPISCLSAPQATALGSAICGALVAGEYDDIFDASKKMASPISKTYYPIKSNSEKYEKIYLQYKELCEYYSNRQNA